jgi:hypothetical protein
MAKNKTPKERKFVSVSKASTKADEDSKDVKEKGIREESVPGDTSKTPKSRATGLRITAVVLWLVAIALEILVICLLNGTLYIPGNLTMWVIIGIVLDLICIAIGSLIWKNANRIDPASEKNKIKFFLWNNMGIIAAVLAFLPLVIILIKNKKLNPKTKKIVTTIAAIALIAAIGLSIDYNPVSSEDLAEAKQEAQIQSDGIVYWTRWGHSYHFDPDCRTLQNSSVIFQGTIEEAFDAHRTDPCDFCAGGAEEKLKETGVEETSTD